MRQADKHRRERVRQADEAAAAALAALNADDPAQARKALAAAPRRIAFADIGWKLRLVEALIDIAQDKPRAGLRKLTQVCRRLDDTSLSRDDKGYLRLFALYRGIAASKTGKAPADLREHTENFRFDHTLVSGELKTAFPLKKGEEAAETPPSPAAGPVEGGAA